MAENGRTAQRSPIAPGDCNLARTFEAIGDKWCLMILRSVLYGVMRFDDIHADTGVTKSVLSNRLKRLCAAGLLEKKSYRVRGDRARSEYVASQMTLELILPFIALTQWADRWIDERDVKPVRFLDGRDNSELSVALVNGVGTVVELENVSPVFSSKS